LATFALALTAFALLAAGLAFAFAGFAFAALAFFGADLAPMVLRVRIRILQSNAASARGRTFREIRQ
jgi:hypothetical protein